MIAQNNLSLFSKLASRFSLIPLNGKVPFEKNWQRFCISKREFVEQEFQGHNAGVCCGPASNVLVLDVDDPEAFRCLMKANEIMLPETFTVETGAGKPHYYYKYPKDGGKYGNKSFKHPLYRHHTIFDVRGEGGQVVAAGSIHPDTGKPYRIAVDSPVADIPDWLMKYFEGKQPMDDALYCVPLPEPKYEDYISSLKISYGNKEFILNGANDGDRSEPIMKVLIDLLSSGYDHKAVFYIFDHYPIGEKYKEKGSSRETWLNGEIERAESYIEEQGQIDSEPTPCEQEIKELNKKHAVVMVGGKCLILNEGIDPVFNRHDITLSTVTDFKNYYSNRKVDNPNRGNPPEVSISKVWLESPLRREYQGIVFDPEKSVNGYYNLFRGFAVEPEKGDWSLFKDHIREIISNGNEEVFEYIMSWMADLVQNPGGKRPGTSIVLRGKQGTGKGCFVSQFGSIFGNHFLQINNQRQLTGRFNNHLKDALLVFCDEGIWAGDKSAEGVLKGMITEDFIMVEPKGKDVYPVKNHIRLVVASNNEWVVPAGLEERRFFVLDVSDKYMQNQEYFDPIFEQMDNGGKEAMLYDLLRYDLKDVDLRTFPRTDALMDQITNSMTAIQKFWYETLKEGTLHLDNYEWSGEIKSEELYDRYIEFAGKIGERYKLTNSQFGRYIRELCPNVFRKKVSIKHQGRPWYLCFPSLEECRKDFEAKVNIKVNWDEDD